MPGVSFQSRALGVTHGEKFVICATVASDSPPTPGLVMAAKSGPAIDALGVGQSPRSDELESLADVRRPEARSAEIKRPEGVARSFHVS